MARLLKRRLATLRRPPGTLVHVGESRTETPRITLMDYDEEKFNEKELAKVEGCFPCRDSATVSWINVDGVHDVQIIEEAGQHFGIHPLVQASIVDTSQRPKLEAFDEYLFLVLKMLVYDEAGGGTSTEQVSLILGPRWVISFQERPGDVFHEVRERIRGKTGRIRQMGSDYLVYALIDAIVDHYFVILENLGEKVESLDDALISRPTPGSLQEIKALKREMIVLRKSVWPLREAISGLERSESPLVHKPVRVYFRHVYDHTIQVMDEVMKVLTIIATIFMPLAFVAGVYGMNFKAMPELGWRYGYVAALGVMAAIAGAMLVYFRRRRWI